MGVPRTWRLAAHAPFVVAVLAGVALRVVVMIAYRPALLFPDSFGYLIRAHHVELDNLRPLGYSLFLNPIVTLTGSMRTISLVQHALGIGLALACYLFLLRRGVPRWAATVAVLPVLLDPLQLVLEHYVLSDVLFEVLLVGACLALLWQHRPGYLAVALAGLLAASSGIVRGAGTFILAVFVVALPCLRVPWRKVVVFLVAAAVPIVPYVIAFHAAYGEYAVSAAGPRFLYSRIAPKVHCPGVELPSYEQKLCPSQPIARRPNTNQYMWGGHRAAQWHLHPPPGMTPLQVVKDFDKRLIRAEPLTYAKAVLTDAAGGFAPTRTYEVRGYTAASWLFADHYWSMDLWLDHLTRREHHALKHTSDDHAAAAFLVTYRHWIWTPGPLMAVLLALAAAAVAGFGRARRCGDRVAVGLLAGCCLVTLATGAALSGFSWRYQLPQLPLLPLAGVLAVAALVRGHRPGAPPERPPLRPLDRVAEWLTGIAPPSLRPGLYRATERGLLPAALAVAVACAVGCGCALLAVASGWMAPTTAAVGGCGAGTTAAVIMLVALARARRAELTDSNVARCGHESHDRVPTGG